MVQQRVLGENQSSVSYLIEGVRRIQLSKPSSRNVNSRTFLLLVILLAGSLFSTMAQPALTQKKDDPIVGRWRWADSDWVIEIRSDGSTSSKYGPGVWKSVPTQTAEQKYEISWKGGATVDELTLSQDGKKLTVKNNRGRKFFAVRLD